MLWPVEYDGKASRNLAQPGNQKKNNLTLESNVTSVPNKKKHQT